MSRANELAKNTLIITIGRVSTQFVSFLLLPLYTALLSTEEFGTVDLITTIVQLCVPVVSLMIDQGVFRYLLNSDDMIARKSIISNAFFILTGLNMLFCAVYFVISPFVNLKHETWILFILLATAYSNLFLQVARGLKRATDYSLGSFVCSVTTIVLNVICIAGLRTGAVGMIIATFCGNFICSIFLFVKLRIYDYISIWSVDKGLAINVLKYSIPLIPNQLSVWVMNSSDRVIVSTILGTAANGILAVSHKFSAIYLTFFNIFLLAWHETGTVHYFDEDRNEFFSDMFEKIVAIFSTLCICLIVVLPLVFDWFIDSSFSEAYYNIPIYLCASLFSVVVGVLGVVYVATKNTLEIAKTTMLSAFINIVVHLALINRFELYAASLSTFVGYFVTMVYRIVDTRKYLVIRYNIKKCVLIIVTMMACVVVYYMHRVNISLIAFLAFVVVACKTNADTLQNVTRMIRCRLKNE